MKRWLLPVALLAVVIFGEDLFRGTDVAKMEPVELVWLMPARGGIVIQTDTGSDGWGKSVIEAVEDLKQTATGEIFLETAEYVLLSSLDEEILPELMALFRPSCKVLTVYGEAKAEDMALFLRSHQNDVTLLDWQTETKAPPVLVAKGERMYLAG